MNARDQKAGTSADSAVASRVASDVASADGKEATSLMFLNEVTRKFDSWEVSVYMAHMEEYSYTWEGQQRKGKFFKCTLVWMPDNTQYCYAEIRKTKGSPADIFEKAVDTYRDGFRFRMSKVALNGQTKLEYNNAPCKAVVDLTKTTMTKLLDTGTTITPQPSITCSECLDFNKVQAFDITALVDSVSERRDVRDERKVRDVYLIDGTVSTRPVPKKPSGVSSPVEESTARLHLLFQGLMDTLHLTKC